MKAAALAILLLAGCSAPRHTPEQMRIACECFSDAAYQTYRAETLAALPEDSAPHKCCGECGKNGLPRGKVLSGDKQKIVPCPCPDGCECKKPLTKACPGGTCKP